MAEEAEDEGDNFFSKAGSRARVDWETILSARQEVGKQLVRIGQQLLKAQAQPSIYKDHGDRGFVPRVSSAGVCSRRTGLHRILLCILYEFWTICRERDFHREMKNIKNQDTDPMPPFQLFPPPSLCPMQCLLC